MTFRFVIRFLELLTIVLICLETLQGPMEGIILVVQMHKIIFTLVDLPRGTALRYILHIFAHLYFFYVPVFFENHSIASHQFFTDVPGIFSRLTSLKEPFENISPSAGRHLKLFCRGSFRGTLLYS